MTIRTEQMAEEAKRAAADIAERLGMHEQKDITRLTPNQPIMIASVKGIQMGTLKVRNMVNSRYVAYKLNNESLWEERYEFDTRALDYDSKPTINIFLDKESVLYAGELS